MFFQSLIRIFATKVAKLLSLDNKNKKTIFHFVLFSLIRNFADKSETEKEIMKHDEIYESQNDITNPNDNDDDEL